MSLSTEISRLKLRHVAEVVKHDTSAPFLCQSITDESQREQYQNTVLDANLETYYDLLGENFTMATQFVPLSIEDARFFVHHYRTRENALKLKYGSVDLVTCKQFEDTDEDFYLDSELRAHISDLEQRIQPAITQFLQHHKHVFVKTSSRSPKDAVVFQRRRMFESYRRALQTHLDMNGRVDVDDNDRIIAMLTAATSLLAISSVGEAVLLLRTSERIYQDMLLALDQPHRFTENICVRVFMEGLHPSQEWRCFCAPINDHLGNSCTRMTAITQYCSLACFPSLVDANCDKIAEFLQCFHNEQIVPCLKDSLLLKSGYVCDIALMGDINNAHSINDVTVCVLELNPLLDTTDSGLFSWNTDREILTNWCGLALPVIKVVRKPVTGQRALISSSWRWLFSV